MTQTSIKFIASDMDGTLLDENSQLNPKFFQIYQQLEERHIWFAAASGRQYYSLRETFHELKDKLFFIAENGTLVMHQGKELYSNTLNPKDVEAIIKQVRQIKGAYLVLCGKQSAYIETQDPQALKEFSKYYHRCTYIPDVLTAKDEFIKIAICHFEGTEEHVNPIIFPHFGDTHQVVVSGKIWLDIMNATASKGAAIAYLQDKLGFSYEQTMSFGDYFNDVEMLEQSYHSYAMENAHPEVKKYARFIAPSNQDAGVLQVIESLLGVKNDES